MKKMFSIIILTGFCFLSSVPALSSGRNQRMVELIKKLAPTEVSTDGTYGYTKENPIKVGGYKENVGPMSERFYLYTLRGPNGERIRFQRIGSCCPFQTPHGFNGTGLLDMYEVTYEGLSTPIKLFINMYDYEKPKAPVGFTHIKRRQNNQNG